MDSEETAQFQRFSPTGQMTPGDPSRSGPGSRDADIGSWQGQMVRRRPGQKEPDQKRPDSRARVKTSPHATQRITAPS